MKQEKMDQLTDPAYYILLSVLEARHGYAVMQYIEDMTDGEFIVGPATLYTLVKKLQKAGLITLLDSPGDRRKTYEATQEGREMLQREIERRRRMAAHGAQAFQHLQGSEGNEK